MPLMHTWYEQKQRSLKFTSSAMQFHKKAFIKVFLVLKDTASIN